MLKFEEHGHRYTVDGNRKPSVTQVLSAAKLIDLSMVPWWVLRRASERGIQVHAAAPLLLRNDLDWSTVDPAIGGYVRALDSFVRHTGFTADPDRIEQPFHCKGLDYCGRPDVVGRYRLRGREVVAIVDWKTGLMAAARYQLAAYAHALGVRHRIAVHLGCDGSYRMEWYAPEKQREELGVFLRALDEHREQLLAA